MALLRTRSLGRAVVVVLLALVPAVAVAGPASAESVRRLLTYSCVGKTPIGLVSGYASQDVTADAPATVRPGGSLSIVLTPAPNVLPGQVYNRTVETINDITLRLPVPSNAVFRGISLTSAGYGFTGRASAYRESARWLVVRVPGSIRGGERFQLPQITLELKAGYRGSVRTTLDGFDQGHPHLSFAARVRGQSGRLATIPTACQPRPNVVLTSTKITAAGWPWPTGQ